MSFFKVQVLCFLYTSGFFYFHSVIMYICVNTKEVVGNSLVFFLSLNPTRFHGSILLLKLKCQFWSQEPLKLCSHQAKAKGDFASKWLRYLFQVKFPSLGVKLGMEIYIYFQAISFSFLRWVSVNRAFTLLLQNMRSFSSKKTEQHMVYAMFSTLNILKHVAFSSKHFRICNM